MEAESQRSRIFAKGVLPVEHDAGLVVTRAGDHSRDAPVAQMLAALHWCQETGDRAMFGLRLAGALWPFWHFRSHLIEGRTWLQLFLAQPADTGIATRSIRARALLGAGWLAYFQDDYASGAASGTESLTLYQQESDAGGCAGALNLLDFRAVALGDYQGAIELLEESHLPTPPLAVGGSASLPLRQAQERRL